jgi:hypothetical protein
MGERVERSGRAALRAEPDAGPLERPFDALRVLNREGLEAHVVGRRGPDQRLRQHPVLGLDAGDFGREAREMPVADPRKRRNGDQVEVDEQRLAGPSAMPSALRSGVLPEPPKNPSGIQNFVVVGLQYLRVTGSDPPLRRRRLRRPPGRQPAPN